MKLTKSKLKEIIREELKSLNEAKYKQTYKSITARDKDSRRIWGSQIGHPRVRVRSWSEIEKSGRMKTAYIEIEGDKDWVDAYKKIAFSGKGNFTDVVKSLKESINEGFNFRKTVSELDSEYEWHYVESEGSYAVRFDWKANDRIDPDRSMLINKNGSVEGQVPNDARLKRKMKKLGIKESTNEGSIGKFGKDESDVFGGVVRVNKKKNPKDILKIVLKDKFLAKNIKSMGISNKELLNYIDGELRFAR